ncbi:hypothetical protein BCR32DRAFT_282150 [Anaeromyces robustus]|uniref:Uncharacterized protein n=1 Tax=Anaeromyces robustus TaxID=1754192 RepID=A0A1Y1WYG2_9FUNG|nr:hypothetical protein BCR32DRAFT_282150 [Anaeromyces robustus]|eukprot:ORX78591.1 hypothetical protein BCR32DRAFT_282150 [Anaeromyces robustus]
MEEEKYDDNNELKDDNHESKVNDSYIEDDTENHILNIQSSLNLKPVEINIFNYFSILNNQINGYRTLELLFIFIEALQFFCIFNNNIYFPEQTDFFKKITSFINFRDIVKLITSVILYLVCSRNYPNYILKINALLNKCLYTVLFIPIVYNTLHFINCFCDENYKDSGYKCFNSHITVIATISILLLLLYELFCYVETYTAQYYIPLSKNIKSINSNETIKIYRRVVLLEIANTMIFKIYLNDEYLSSILMFLGFDYLFYIHLCCQNYFSQKLNNFYSSVWFSLSLQSFIHIFFSIFKIKLIYPIFLGIGCVGFICGWFLNKYYYNFYSNKIYDSIKNKYNQQHIINRLNDEKKLDETDEDESLSLETIAKTKKYIKNEYVFKRSSDCSYISKFIEFNRSLISFNLVNNLFKEGIIQFERDPNLYIQYWNHLHGIKYFIEVNNCCFFDKESEEFIQKIDFISEKLLEKCVYMSKSIFMKYLIFNATNIYETDKLYIKNLSSNNHLEMSASNIEVIDIRNNTLQYHIISINYLKKLMDGLRILERQIDIENAMILNDKLTEVLTVGEKKYNNYLLKSRYSKESLILAILFFRNSMNRDDIADHYIEMFEDNENPHDEDEKKYNDYAKSEAMSSSVTSESKSRKIKVLKRHMLHKCQKPMHRLLFNIQILTTLAIIVGAIGIYFYMDCFSTIHNNVYLYVVSSRSPSCGSNVKKNMRLLSLQAASGENPYGSEFYNVLDNERYFIDQVYIANIYKVQFTSTYGEYTFHPLNSEVIDLPKDINYFKTLEKMLRKIDIVLGQANETYILTPDYLNNIHIRYFNLNTRERFGIPFIRSLVLRNQFLQNMLIKHQNTFYYILGGVAIFMLYIITIIIIPNTDTNFKFINHIFILYKTLPSSYLNDKSNECIKQIQDICDNYDIIEDEGFDKNKDKKKKTPSTKKVKYSLLLYCLIVTMSLIIPLLTVFIYKSKCQHLIDYMVNSNLRSYRLSSINLYIIEHILNDRNYYSIGEPLSLIKDNLEKLETLEDDLQNGVYGGPFSLFETINNTPGCYRSTYLKYECDQIKYNKFYNEELTNSSIDYLMVEYVNKVNEFISNNPEKHYDLKNATEIKEAFDYITNDPYIQAIKYLSYDIIGHIDAMNELGTQYIRSLIETYEYVTLIGHIIGSLIIFITFFIFISRPIKKQLRIIDVLINITFAIPSTIYGSSQKMKE